jgi:hypothetical protein
MFCRLNLRLAVLTCVEVPTLAKPHNPLVWADPEAPEAAETSQPLDNNTYTVPGSELRLTRSQIEDNFNSVDWRPQDHPPMPAVVAHGTPPDHLPCADCNMPSG